MTIGTFVRGTLVAATMMVAAAGAQAALISCPDSFVDNTTSKVENAGGNATAVSDCQFLNTPDSSNVASIANINSAGFFGTTTWETNGQNQLGSNASSGNWSIANAAFNLYEYIIVFKSGAQTNLTAFLFNGDFDSGVWSTPFTKPTFDLPGNSQSKEVSHFTIARRAVPEPGTLALLGAALFGLGLARRRRSC